MEHQCIQEGRIQALEREQAKTEVYYKNIQKDIEEIKQTLKELQQQPRNSASMWQPIVLEVIKLISTMAIILGAIAGAKQILTR